ncbi:MAG TPA: DJ-1/PfpI family protein [Gemmatimonadales bacterium]
MALRIGILGYDGVQALDLVGPAEAFAATPQDTGTPPYEVVIIGLERRRFTSETGITMHADTTISSRLRLDTLIVPGGKSMRENATSRKTAAWVAARAGGTRRIAAVCTGIYGLAPTGLLDGRRVTTHWRFARDLAERYPLLRVDADALFISDGAFYTSAGITAGIDLALGLIEEDFGPTAALAVARELVVYLKRPGGQQQFSEPLQFQHRATDRFADLTTWIAGHLDADLSVEAQAARVFLCTRQFSRVFTQIHGTTPGAFVEELRLGEASRRLASRRVGVDAIARSVGYGNVDVFRRAFERRFGVSPTKYRTRFSGNPRRAKRHQSGRRATR